MRRTFALAGFPIPRYTRLSRRWTSVRIILSSRRLSSVRSVSISARAGLYCDVMFLAVCGRHVSIRSKQNYIGRKEIKEVREEGSSSRSHSLTDSRVFYNHVEVHGRLKRPIFLHRLPCQLFDALKLLEFELAKRMLVVSFEIKVDDLLWE
jgi:hypothetical protein